MSNSNSIRLLIAEGDEALRQALSLFFSAEDGIEVVGQVPDHAKALDLCQELQPDVVLIDLELRKSNLVSFIRALCQECPNSKIVVVSPQLDGATNPDVILQAGASTYLTRRNFASDIVGAVRQMSHHQG